MATYTDEGCSKYSMILLSMSFSPSMLYSRENWDVKSTNKDQNNNKKISNSKKYLFWLTWLWEEAWYTSEGVEDGTFTAVGMAAPFCNLYNHTISINILEKTNENEIIVAEQLLEW